MTASTRVDPKKPVAATSIALALSLSSSTPMAQGIVFTPRDILGWEVEQFKGPVQYRIVRIGGREAVHALCAATGATARFLKRDIDLRETPILEWSWRIEDTFGAIEETTKTGDDYPVRLYAVFDGGFRRWRTRAVNYVWASNQPKGSVWPNAYAFQAMMTAVQSGPSRAGEWVTQRRDLAADFERLHGSGYETIHGLAIMTDCDDVGRPIEGWYGEIRLLTR
jgi:hypothetical protein